MSFSIEKSTNYTDTSFQVFPQSLYLNVGTVPRWRSDRFLLNPWNSSSLTVLPKTIYRILWQTEAAEKQNIHTHTNPLSQIQFSKLLTILNSNCFTTNFRKKSASTAFCKGRKWCMLSGPTFISVTPIAFDNNTGYKSSRGSMTSGKLTWNKQKITDTFVVRKHIA
jgi:hypothetical protein